MTECYMKNLDDVILEFCINGISSHDSSWVDVDIRIISAVIKYDLKDWESDGEIFELEDIQVILQLMEKWLEGALTSVEEYETLEPDLLLKFYPGDEKRIDFCICLQTNELGFSENYIILPLIDDDAVDFVGYWKMIASRLLQGQEDEYENIKEHFKVNSNDKYVDFDCYKEPYCGCCAACFVVNEFGYIDNREGEYEK